MYIDNFVEYEFFFVSFRAPTDCVQYFTGISGEVKSFNFDGGIQLRDIQYTICIRRETGSCGIQYTVQDNTTPDSYDLSDAATNVNVGYSFLTLFFTRLNLKKMEPL